MFKNHALTRMKDWLRPWIWLPVLLLFSLHLNFSDLLRLGSPWLVLPVAIWLGHRYGRMGIAVVAASGIGLVPYLRWGYSSLPAFPDIYIAALILARCAIQGDIFTRLAWRPVVPWLLPIAIGLLAIYLGLWGKSYGDGVEVRVMLHFRVLIFLLMFSLGLSGTPLKTAIASLALATLVGIVLEALPLPRDAGEWLMARRADLPLIGLTELKYLFATYILDTPKMFLAAAGYLLFGRSLRDAKNSPVLTVARPWLGIVIAAGLLVSMGQQVNLWLVNLLLEPNIKYVSSLPYYARWFGVIEVAPLLGLVAGRYFGYPGLLALLTGVVLMTGLEGWMRSADVAHLHMSISLAVPLYIVGFGILGVQIHTRREGRSAPWWSWAWAQYLLIVALVLYGLMPLEKQLDLLFMCLAFLALVTISLALAQSWKRRAPQRQDYTGWLTLATAVLLGHSLIQHYQAVWSALTIMSQQVHQVWSFVSGAPAELRIDNNMLLASLCLFCIGVVIMGIRKLVASAVDMRDDLLALYALLKRWSKTRPTSAFTTEPQAAQPQRADHALPRWLGRLGWICMAAALVLPIIVSGQNAWSKHERKVEWDKQRREEESERSQHYEESRKKVDPVLLAAVQSFIADWPKATEDPGYDRIYYRVPWSEHADYPDERLRIFISVKSPRDRHGELGLLERRQQALEVLVFLQEKGPLGLWLERDSPQHYKRQNAIKEEIREKILNEAAQLDAGGEAL